ncbi:MAG: sulfotransferase [Gammaproteobacteria bacterium]
MSSLTSPSSAGKPTRVEEGVRRARDLVQRQQFGEALALAQALLREVPENRDVLYLIAVSQRYLGRIPDALRTLDRFESLHPDFGRLFQERGHCYRAVGETLAAVDSYARAVALNPALAASLTALRDLLRSLGRTAESDAAAAQIAMLASLPQPIVTATHLLAEGEVYAAEGVVRQFLQAQPNHVEGMRLLAHIGVKLDVLDDAEFLLESALQFDPANRAVRYDYANVLSQRHKHAQALEQSRRLLEMDPANRAYRTIQANACVGLGDHEAALGTYRDLLAAAPQPADLHLCIAHALKTLGRQGEAIESYRAAAVARPGFGDAYWSLANLKTYRFTDEEVTQMRAQEALTATRPVDRFHLCFALGKALEDRAEYAESFACYARGNALKKAETRYQPDVLERSCGQTAELCTSAFLEQRRGGGSESAAPIFIVGLPRAGSTLLEQILASHSKVEGTMELADIPRIVHRLGGRQENDAPPRYPQVLGELSPAQLRELGEKYLADTQIFRTGKPFFIDKMPNNFRHVGLIHLILPNAKIIDARREPMACCFSNFKQLFASGQEFTYSFEDIARYYRMYVRLMDHWDAVLPGKVLRVQHESVVDDLEGNVRRLLDFVGLDFEPACLEFHKTERSVRTASSEQVRRPIFRDGLDQWRNFAPWLGPLREALQPPGD